MSSKSCLQNKKNNRGAHTRPQGRAKPAPQGTPRVEKNDYSYLRAPVFESGEIANLPLPELLAPAGTREALEAAVLCGADAVYLGGTMFNARMNAKNFDDDALASAVEFCHKRGVLVYVTLNTLVYDRELRGALEYAGRLSDMGVDAAIVADLGLARLIKERLPLPIHASTQASCHDSAGVRALADLGFSRVVCARESSAGDIGEMTKCGVEIEAFAHGALCVCHSGQCLMSSVIGGRSGNRGECAQPCRLPYNGGYPLSLRDLCLAGHVPELISLGVASMKLEGRMKSPEYVAEIVTVYRRLLDERRAASEDEIAHLAAVFSRQGFTDGYFAGKVGRDMLGVRREEDKAAHYKKLAKPDSRTLPEIKIERERAPELTLAKPRRGVSTQKKSARFASPEGIFRGAERIFEEIYLPLDKFTAGAANGVILPSVIFDRELDSVRRQLTRAYEAGATHALVGNLGHGSLARECGFILHGDFRLNCANGETQALLERDFCDIILSPELTLPQIRDMAPSKRVIAYGRLPLMLLERRVGAATLIDRKGARFPIQGEGVRDILLNSCPVMMCDRQDELEAAGARDLHFIFTRESADEAKRIAALYDKGGEIPAGMRFTRIARK